MMRCGGGNTHPAKKGGVSEGPGAGLKKPSGRTKRTQFRGGSLRFSSEIGRAKSVGSREKKIKGESLMT